MGWMETLTKEAFFLAVRDPKADFETLEKRFEKVENQSEIENEGVTGK